MSSIDKPLGIGIVGCGLIGQKRAKALGAGGRLVACADIDATDPEPLPDGHWMYSHPAVRLSPHVSWNWSGAFQAMYATFVDNLRLYLNDEPLLSVVNPVDGY